MGRSGTYVTQLEGHRAFIPAGLPPNPPLAIGGEVLLALGNASLALGRLDGIATQVPNPDLFVGMYVRQEAVLSSQIEGTQASLADILQFEAGIEDGGDLRDVREVSNYVRAMNDGLARLHTLPLSKRLVREIHGILLNDTRGSLLTPGEFRTTQNWIGAPGCTLATARFVPPPPHAMQAALDDWERFLHDDSQTPLIQAALAHAQFETIHPFLDGNGRIGRLLITFLLCTRGVLQRPLLYLSAFLKRNRTEYYDRLQAVRDHGAWEPWLLFFLRGVAEVATDATATAGRILDLRNETRTRLLSEGRASANLQQAVDHLFLKPAITVAHLQQAISVSAPTAGNIVNRLVELGTLQEITGMRRNRSFQFAPFLALFESTDPIAVPEPLIDRTGAED